PAGTYSLWTIPKKESWLVLFNKEVPDWGVKILSGGKETTRKPEQDALQIEVPTEILASPQESFHIDFQNGQNVYLVLSWDETAVKVPINQ
ncbi:MAG: DUF2911 domain-containing protein, partial [Maribacter sp.]|nr:DUF2911 domain-containing protein [Maribacter sp.]